VLQEFKDFINKGGVFEAAVGLVLALAFIPIIDAVVNGVLMQIIAAIFGEPSFDALTFNISDTPIFYGRVITTTIAFTAVGAVLFMLVKAYNASVKPAEEDSGPSETDLLSLAK